MRIESYAVWASRLYAPSRGVANGAARFVQTVGGRAGFPAPRRVSGKPLFRIHSATAWTTLALTIRADGSSDHELEGASLFPRHWIYDRVGKLVQKAGTIDFKRLVPRSARRAHAVGRRGLGSVRHRRGDGPRASALA